MDALLLFFLLFIGCALVGHILFYRKSNAARLAQLVESEHPLRDVETQEARRSIEQLIEPLEGVLPKSPEEVSVAHQRLIRAGYRQDSYVRVFYGCKVLVPLVLMVVLTLTRMYQSGGAIILYIAAAGIGYLVPDFWIGHLIKRRQTEIRLALPDAIDLMVVCIEAGLSLDQATVRAAAELKTAQPDVADELGLVVLEHRAGRPRAEAWGNFALRADLDTVRNLVSLMVQAERFGTSVAKTLRVYSETQRIERRQKVEELAAKTTVKMVVPLVFFIFPSIFVVTLGSTALAIMQSFDQIFK